MTSRKYCGFRVVQRQDPAAISFFVFAATARDIRGWSTVNRLEEQKGGIQRRVSAARLRALERFFKLNSINVIPTSVVLAFLPGTATFRRLDSLTAVCSEQTTDTGEWGELSFDFDVDLPENERPAFVVDGQHRLLGMAHLEQEDLPILVSALLDAGPDEQAFQFIVINNKASRVPSDLVRSLIVDFNEEALQDRLQTARVSLQPQALLVAMVDDESESPFYQMVDWERRRGEGRPCVKPAAIEDSLKYLRRRFSYLDEDQDALIDFFFAMWVGVRLAYPELWDNTDNQLFSNAGFKAFSEYLTDQIEALMGFGYVVDIMDQEAITEAAQRISSQIDVGYWTIVWQLKSLDTSAGREIIKDDLKTIRQNGRDGKLWSEELKLVGLQDSV